MKIFASDVKILDLSQSENPIVHATNISAFAFNLVLQNPNEFEKSFRDISRLIGEGLKCCSESIESNSAEAYLITSTSNFAYQIDHYYSCVD